MDFCKYVLTSKTYSVGELSEEGYPRPCVVAPWTRVLRPSGDVVGPCSGGNLSMCEPSGQSDVYVWFFWGGRYYVYQKQIVDTLFQTISETLATSRPHAVLLAGMSRTGKTTLAKMVLSALGMPHRVVSAASLLSKYVGETEQAVIGVLDTAATLGVSIVLDEFDAIMPVGRGGEQLEEVHKARNALLTKMDEVKASKSPALIFATTNVDTAALPREVRNRFDTIIEFPRPSPQQYEILLRLAGRYSDALLEKAVSTMMSFEKLQKCVAKPQLCRNGGDEGRVVIYASASVKPVTSQASEVVEGIRRAVARKRAFRVTIHEEKFVEDPAVNLTTVTISAVTNKPVLVVRDQKEFESALSESKYLDAIVYPLFSVDTHIVASAYRRAPLAVPNQVPGVREYVVTLSSLLVNGQPGHEGMKKVLERIEKLVYE